MFMSIGPCSGAGTGYSVGEKTISLPECASETACLNDPGPISLLFITVICAPCRLLVIHKKKKESLKACLSWFLEGIFVVSHQS